VDIDNFDLNPGEEEQPLEPVFDIDELMLEFGAQTEEQNETVYVEMDEQNDPPEPKQRGKKGVKKQEEKDSPSKTILMYLHDLVFLLAGVLILFLVFFRMVIVSGDSMYNTLWDGDYLLVMTNLFYQEPQREDIVIISKDSFENGEPIVKRVIATAGQTVDIDFDKGIVYVDGVALEEDYIYTKTTVAEGLSFPLTVEEGCIFVMGDNRRISKDSRNPEIGMIDKREVIGKAVFLLLPGDNGGRAQRDFSRIGALW
jgi:signal peptidase I